MHLRASLTTPVLVLYSLLQSLLKIQTAEGALEMSEQDKELVKEAREKAYRKIMGCYLEIRGGFMCASVGGVRF